MTPRSSVSDLIFKDECYAIIGACFEVYKDKGCGFYEPVYQECLAIEAVKTRIALIFANFMRLQLTLGSIGVNS
jgi:GxxExxY protein